MFKIGQTQHYLTWRETVADWMAEPRQDVPYDAITLSGIEKVAEYFLPARDLETIVEQTSNRNNPIKLPREEILAILSSRLTGEQPPSG